MRELSDSCENSIEEGKNILHNFEEKARVMGLSFDNMSKEQQLAIISATGRHGTCYRAFLSNASFQIFILARNNFDDIQQIAEGFNGQDLTELSGFLRVYGGYKIKDFREKFDEIKDAVVEAEHHAQDMGQDGM